MDRLSFSTTKTHTTSLFSINMRPAVAALASACMLGAAPAALADLTVVQETELRADGMLSMLASDMQSTTYLSGDKSKTESKTSPKSRMMRMFAPKGKDVSIVRLDKGLIWQLKQKEKEYTELTFAQMKAQMKMAEEQMQQAAGAGGMGGGGAMYSDDACELSTPKTSVQETGKDKKIAGLRAQQVIVQVEQTCSMPERDQVCEIKNTWEGWITQEMPELAEMQAFHTEFARQAGMENWAGGSSPAANIFASSFGEAWKSAVEKVESLNGIPLDSVIRVEFGGEKCEGLSELQAASAELLEDAADAGVDGAFNEAASQAGRETAEQTAGMFGDGVIDSIAGAGVGRAAGELVSGMFGGLRNMGKKSDSDGGAAKAGGSEVVFEIRNTIKKVSDKPISADEFEPPSGWTKVDAPQYGAQ